MTWDKTKPISSGYLVSSEIRQQWAALERALLGVNLIADPTMLIWPAGDSAAPAHYTLAGAGATIARCGTGLADTNRKVGRFCSKVIAGGGAAATFQQAVLTTTSYDDYLDGLPTVLGGWVQCNAGTTARLAIDDGAGTPSYSSYHTGAGGGDGAWEWLTVGRTIDAAATKLSLQAVVATSGTARVSGLTMGLGEAPPAGYQPAPTAYGCLLFPVDGGVAVAVNKARFLFGRPALVKDVQLHVVTAPATQALIVDVNHWDGTTQQTMFSTRPQIAAAGYAGSAQPDGTYRYRCFAGGFGTTRTDAELTMDIDQVGTGTTGASLTVMVRCLQFLRPLEAFLGYNE
jgi:hypothetical protein